MQSQRFIPKLLPLAISALLLCTFLLATSEADGSLRAPFAATPQNSCPFEASNMRARVHQAEATPEGRVVPPSPLYMQLCRYYMRDGEMRLAPARMYPSKAVARSFARRFNRLPLPPLSRRCESERGYVTAYFGYQRRVVPVTITLGGCRLVSGAARDALATPDLVSDLAELTSKGDIPLPGPER